jgi:dextranase
MEKRLIRIIFLSACLVLLNQTDSSGKLMTEQKYPGTAAAEAGSSVSPVRKTTFFSNGVSFFSVQIPGDLNRDGRVNLRDLALLSNTWMRSYNYDELSILARDWLSDSTVGQNAVVNRVYPDKARYDPGEEAVLTVELSNGPVNKFDGAVILSISRPGHIIFTTRQPVTLAPNTTNTVVFTWRTPVCDFQGYLVEARLTNGSFTVSAIDVSSDWRRYPRYGYITEFYDGQPHQRAVDIFNQLSRNYHINCVQFYDWMWRHENVIQRIGPYIVDPWIDWRGAHISYNVLTDLAAEAHQRNIAAMPYFQVYIGLDGYEQISGVSRQWGLFSDQSHLNQFHHTAGNTNFWVFNPVNINWQNHLTGEYTDALLSVGFDGIHLDQLGDIGGGTYYDYNDNFVDLGNNFSPMLNLSKNHLDYLETQYPGLVGHDALTFNMVDGGVNYWGVNDVVHNSLVDFLYSELWNNETYKGVYDFVKKSRAESAGKGMVLAAYVNRYEDTGGYFDSDSVRLADAAFFAGGAFHIELGDGDQMLGNEFFPNRSRQMTAELKSVMKDYYDFITANESLLFAPELDMGDTGLQWISIDGQPVSGNGAGNTIWFLSRHCSEFEVLHLVNLLGNDDQWRNVANTPPLLNNLAVKYRLGPNAVVKRVYLASPDLNHGSGQSLPYIIGSDTQDTFVSFTVPSLSYWDMIYFERLVTPPAGDRYEAEDAVKSGVYINTNHSGYSGTGFVDHFGSAGDSVSFVIAVPTEDDYSLWFRYANATGATATRMVFADGDYGGNVSLPPLTNWDTWAVAPLTMRLAPGVHQIVIYFSSSNSGAINLDYLEVR